VDGHGPGAPLDGLARAGWKLVYTDTPTDYIKGADERSKVDRPELLAGLHGAEARTAASAT
jgi:hypothetical protein